MSAETTRLDAGTWVRDRDGDDTRYIVVERLAEQASDVFVPALDRSVADWPPNSEYPADDPVVRAVPTTRLAERFGDAWSVTDVLDAYGDGDLEDGSVTVYSYPASRLTPIQ